MDSAYEIKIYIDNNEFKKACMNSISLFNFRYLEFNKNKNLNLSSKYAFMYFTIWKNSTLISVLKQSVFCGYKCGDYVLNPSRTILYITTNNEYKNQGYSKVIIEEYFKFLNLNNIQDEIYLSPYSKDGWQYIKKNLHNLANKYNLILIDKNYCYEF